MKLLELSPAGRIAVASQGGRPSGIVCAETRHEYRLASAGPCRAGVRDSVVGGARIRAGQGHPVRRFFGGLKEEITEFERTAGITVTTTSGASVGDGPNTIAAQLRRGVSADVIVLSREGLTPLIAEKRIVAGSDTNLAQSVLGLIVRAGAAKPDIRSC